MAKHNSAKNSKARAAKAAPTAPKKPQPRSPRSPWSEEEDARLKSLVAEAGGSGCSWVSIATAMRGRNSKQCRERFTRLRPGVVVGNWTADEDELITSLQKRLGNQWVLIANELSGRTDSAVKNRWHTLNRSAMYKKREETLVEKKRAKTKRPKKKKSIEAKKKKAALVRRTPTQKSKANAKCPVAAAINYVEAAVATHAPFAGHAELPAKGIVTAKRPDPHLEAAWALKELQHSPMPMRQPKSVNASDLFSPSRNIALATPTPAIPLSATANCLSGPHLPFFSPLKVARSTPEASGMTPPYQRKRLSFTAALVGSLIDSPVKCAAV